MDRTNKTNRRTYPRTTRCAGFECSELAGQCGLPVEHISRLSRASVTLRSVRCSKSDGSATYPLDVLMFGEEPKMNAYFLTRWGTGISVERTKAYKYQSLASGFRNRKADPFLVTVEPKPEDTPIYYNTHYGQEFNLVIEGRMLLSINGKDLILEQGDSLYFDSSLPHGMKALDGKAVKFLAIVM